MEDDILETLFEIRAYCFVSILAYTGLRATEIVKLRLIDIKLKTRFLYVLGKGNKLRQVIINDLVYKAISQYLEERNAIKTSNPYLFIGQTPHLAAPSCVVFTKIF